MRQLKIVAILSLALAHAQTSAAFAQTQQYVIMNYARGPPPPGANPSITVGSVATDTLGNVYFTGRSSGNACVCVFKLDPSGVLTHIAGSPGDGFSGDGGPATSAQLGGPAGLAVDGAGNVFIAEYSNGRIRKVSPDGIITTVAGGGSLAGSSADGGPATGAQLYYPAGVAVDGSGDFFFSESEGDDWISDGENRIRKVSPDGIITTVAGNGTWGFSGDGGPATSAQLADPGSLTLDSAGNLFFVENYDGRLRQVSPEGIITTVVDANVSGLAMDPAGNLFFILPNSAVAKRFPAGAITTVLEADAGLSPSSLAVDGAGNLFLTGAGPFNYGSLVKVSPDGSIIPLAGNGACCYTGDGGPATSAQLQLVNSVADGAGNLFIGGTDGAGNVYLADTGNRRIRKVDPRGTVTTVAGNGAWNALCNSMTGDNGPAAGAQLCGPSQVAVDGAGNLFIVDRNRIRKVSTDGTISSVAGDGTVGTGTGGDGMPAMQPLAYPNSVAVDPAGNVFFTEWARVRRISPDGIITTVAGDGARPVNWTLPAGDGQPATSVELFAPSSVTVDGAGNIYFVDGTSRVRMVSPDGIITTVAGNGRGGYHLDPGDGGLAANAPLWLPSGVTVDSTGNLYISEQVRVRKVTTDGIIHTIAGTAEPGYSGDGGPATQAQLHVPTGLTVDGAGNVYFADSLNNVVRILRPIQ